MSRVEIEKASAAGHVAVSELLRVVAVRVVSDKLPARGFSGKNPLAGLVASASCLRLQPDLVIDRLPQPLLTPEVALRRFHRNVSKKELDLLELTFFCLDLYLMG